MGKLGLVNNPEMGNIAAMNLKAYLSQTGKKPREFAEEIDVSERAVIKWLRGERRPRPELIEKIRLATAGAVQPNDFFPREAA